MAGQISLLSEFLQFLIFAALGAFLSFIYDIFRAFRRLIKHKNWAINLQDIIYWLFCPVYIFYIVLRLNYGELRWYIILAIFLGSILYFSTISSFLMKILIRFMSILFYPFKIILNFFRYIKKKVQNAKKTN